MSKLLYYKPRSLVESASAEFPGTRALSQYTKLYSAGAVPFDRTGTITTPLKILPLYPMPKLVPFSKTYEQVCNERAAEILGKADAQDCDVYVQWSGGIDSTLAVVSLLKMATDRQRERIVILLSQRSITEYRWLYETHIRGRLRADTARALPRVLGSRHILVSGEHNDQLFGSDIMLPLIRRFGNEVIHAPFERRFLFDHYMSILNNEPLTNFFIDCFDRLREKAPLPIETTFEFTWWINFSLKWQTVYARALTFTDPENVGGITQEYLRERYLPFYNTDDFQLWSMSNPDKRIKDTWNTYKWPAKEAIYSFTKDEYYLQTKMKIGSLGVFMVGRDSYKALDTDLVLYDTFDLARFYEPDNDFAAIEKHIA